MRRTILSSVVCLSVSAILFPHYLSNGTIFGGRKKKGIEREMCFEFLRHFSLVGRIEWKLVGRTEWKYRK
jgi:hypothetical protein